MSIRQKGRIGDAAFPENAGEPAVRDTCYDCL